MSSINTNNGAMIALQTMRQINHRMGETQSNISTGKKVNTAKDNAAVWSIAKTMESDVASFKGISDSLALGESSVSVARNAAETVADLLKEIKVKVVAAQETAVPKATLQTDIAALREQITTVVKSAQFNGLNMLNASQPSPIEVLASLDRDSAGLVTASKISVGLHDLQVDGAILPDLSTMSVLTSLDATAALAAIEPMIKGAIDAAASFGSSEKRISIQKDFVSKLSDAMTSGIGAMVDANMEETSARLQALQVQQQLATQSLSIANQAPQALLTLFR